MTVRRNMVRLSVAAGLAAAQAATSLAATPPVLDKPPAPTAAPAIEILSDKPHAVPVPLSGNPLWAVPLSMLAATRERPIFLPTRRPPAPIVAAPRITLASAPPPAAPPPGEPTRPPLALVGAVVGESEAIAVFVDQATKNVVRLRTGQDHDGWVLSSVKGREATLQKDTQTAVFALPAPGAAGPAPGPAAGGVASVPVVPAGGEAPFVPRSTPKNGEPDGL